MASPGIKKKSSPQKKKKSQTRSQRPTSRQNKKTERQNAPHLTESDEFDHLEEEDDVYMTVGDHLEELRQRIILILIIITIFAIGIGIFSPSLHKFLLEPFHSITGKNLIMSKAYGGLLVLMKLSLLLAMTASMPFTFWILWGFVSPAVTKKTAILGHSVVGISSLLFWAGVIICWYYIFPLSIRFLFQDTLLWGIDPIHPVEEYYGFMFTMHIGSGIMFQLPLVLVILGALGIVTLDWHKAYWKYILVVIFFLAAVLTPPDPVSQLILGTTLSLLYCISVAIVYLIERTRKKELEQP